MTAPAIDTPSLPPRVVAALLQALGWNPQDFAAALAGPAAVGDAEQPDPTLSLLTVEEAARRLGIGRTTCYRLISSGELESVPVGRLRRVPAEAVTEYVARLRQTCTRRPAA